MTTLSTLPPATQTFLDSFVVRSRRLALARAAGGVISFFLGWMLFWCAADRWLGLPAWARLTALAAGILYVLLMLAPRMRALWRPADRIAAAAEVERRYPRFAQRLLTVTSRMLGNADYRGSDEILLRLAREVDREVASLSAPARLVPAGKALLPWIGCAILAVIVCALFRAPDLRFRELALRFLNPLADIPPVTTTQLSVLPGSQDIVQSQPLTIAVEAQRLGDAPVTLALCADDRTWSRVGMPAVGPDRFRFTLPAVDHDLRYYVSGGDARSREYLVRVLRRPAVAQFRIAYEFPSYTRLRPITVTNADGRIEAPIGTTLILIVTATEPLSAALMTVGGQRLLMDRTDDPFSRQVRLTVQGDARYTIDLISTRDVAGAGPTATIHALPNLPPQVRLAHGGQEFYLRPRDILPVSYEALDDYGLAALSLSVQVNADAPTDVPVPIWADPRRQQDAVNFDLGTMNLKVGDLLTLRMKATDTAGKVAASDPLLVLISPESVDLDASERIAELHTAVQLGRSLASALEEALNADEEAGRQQDRRSQAFVSASSRRDRALSSAAQTGTLLRQSLLRAIRHGNSAPLATALAAWVDVAEFESACADRVFRDSGRAGLAQTHRDQLRRALDECRQTQRQISDVAEGEQAAALLKERADLLAAEKAAGQAASFAGQQPTLSKMRSELAAALAPFDIRPDAPDIDQRLGAKVAVEQAALSAARPVDFTAAARQWAEQFQHDTRQQAALEGRLAAAAEAEALRPDANLVRARDLEVASQAATAIANRARAGHEPDPKVLLAFAADLQILFDPTASRPSATTQGAQEGADALTQKAREELAAWAGDPPGGAPPLASRQTTSTATLVERQRQADLLAMQASAAAAHRQYARAAALDQATRRALSNFRHQSTTGATEPQPGMIDPAEHHHELVRRAMEHAQKLDGLGRQQDEIARETAVTSPPDLAKRQQHVLEQIDQISARTPAQTPTDWARADQRDRATACVLEAQEQLASMPQALERAEAAARARRDAASRAMLAQQQAESAAADQKQAALRAASQAQADARDADDRLTHAIGPVSPATARALADLLEPFAPETADGVATINQQLVPALAKLVTAFRQDNPEGVNAAAADARRALEASQRQLSQAHQGLVRDNPLLAARWFARAAAESLAAQPPDVGRARRNQAGVSTALARAWDQSIHRAAAERLAALPTMAAVLSPTVGHASQQGSPGDKFPALREWNWLRPLVGPEVNTALHDTDPPGFEESLRLYFEAINKAREGK